MTTEEQARDLLDSAVEVNGRLADLINAIQEYHDEIAKVVESGKEIDQSMIMYWRNGMRADITDLAEEVINII